MTRNEEVTGSIYKEESYAIIGACMGVYKDKGCGFLEPVYHECLTIEFEFRGIPFISKPLQTLQYRGRTLVQTFAPDFLCYEKTILEIKAVSALVDEHRAQVLNYLSATAANWACWSTSGITHGWNTSGFYRGDLSQSIFDSKLSHLFVCLVGKMNLQPALRK